MTDSSLARRERQALCDTALSLEPHAPTLCGEWDVTMLLAHLIVRERMPFRSAGIMVPAFSGMTEKAMRTVAATGVPAMVERLRKPPFTTYSLPVIEKYTQTLEYVVHHEDLRRAAPGWAPRELPAADEDELWRLIKGAAKLASRRAKVPIEIRRPASGDRPPGSATVRKGADPVVVTAPPVELVLFFFGRSQVHDLTLDGPPDKVALLQQADLGF